MPDANSAGWFGNIGQEVAKAASEVGQPATTSNIQDRQQAEQVQARQMAGAAGQMLASAQGGHFAIEPEAGQTLIKAYQDSVKKLDGMNNSIVAISQAPKLGTTPGANVVAPFTQQIAAGGNGGPGFADFIKDLRSTLVQMEQAVRQAMKNYQEADQQAADGVRKAARGL